MSDENIAQQLHAECPWMCRKVVYISGPMSKLGYTKCIHLAHTVSVIEGALVAEGWEVQNPYGSVHTQRNFAPEIKADWLNQAKTKLLKMSLMQQSGISDVAIILMLDGWHDSDGALEEYSFAQDHGIPAYTFTELGEGEWEMTEYISGDA